MRSLRLVAIAMLLATGCRRHPAEVSPPPVPAAAAPAPAPNRDPYRNVTPQKMKQKVEDADKHERDRDDKILQNAH